MYKIDRNKIVWTERDPVHLKKCFFAEINGALVRVGESVNGDFYWFAANGKSKEYCSSRASAEQEAVNHLNNSREERRKELMTQISYLDGPISYGSSETGNTLKEGLK